MTNKNSNPDGSGIAELRESEKKYRAVFENTGTGTIIIDYDMTILNANARFEAMTGYTRSEIENRMKWSQFVAPADLGRMQEYHYGRRKDPENIPTEYECRIIDKSGNLKYIDMKVGMIPNTMNSIASFMDITKRKLAEAGLRESEAKLSAIVETFEGFIYITTVDKRLEFMNKALETFSGEKASGQPCHKVIFGLDTPCDWCTDNEVREGVTIRGEMKHPANNRWYYSVRTPIFNRDGEVEKIQSILIDITDRKLTEEAVAESAKHLHDENIRLRSAIRERYKFGEIIGKSKVMQAVYSLILKAASSNAHVMINGESGTGKELVAKAIHQMSERKEKAFIPVNCGAISEKIIESEFFGYRKGAFTGAERDKKGFLDIADGGTLFLDEIGEIGLPMQVKLLRAIEGGGYTPVGGNQVLKPNIRIIAATNRNLKELVQQGQMREDFYYRIHIIPITLPPLRDRKEDIPLLIDHFMAGFGSPEELPPVNGALYDALNRYYWPGNVRELQNVLKQYVTLREIRLPNGPVDDSGSLPAMNRMAEPEGDSSLSEAVDAFEKDLIRRTLEKNHWKKNLTSEVLGIHRKTLFSKIKKYGLE